MIATRSTAQKGAWGNKPQGLRKNKRDKDNDNSNDENSDVPTRSDENTNPNMTRLAEWPFEVQFIWNPGRAPRKPGDATGQPGQPHQLANRIHDIRGSDEAAAMRFCRGVRRAGSFDASVSGKTEKRPTTSRFNAKASDFMDQLKLVLEHKFSILTAVAVLLPPIGWWMASGDLAAPNEPTHENDRGGIIHDYQRGQESIKGPQRQLDASPRWKSTRN